MELVKSTSVSNRFCLLLFVRTSQKVCMSETSMFDVNSFFFLLILERGFEFEEFINDLKILFVKCFIT